MPGPTQEEIDLRNFAVAILRENIRKLTALKTALEGENAPIKNSNKKRHSLSHQMSKHQLVVQLKTELENLVLASENVEQRLSGAAILEKMYNSQARFLEQEKSSLQALSNDNSEFRKFVSEVQLYVQCQNCHNMLRTYANDKYGSALKYFRDIIDKRKYDPKNRDKPTIALDISTKIGDFLAAFYTLPVQPRDQLVIDTFTEYGQSEENKKTELYAIGAMMADIASFQVTLGRIAKTKIEFKDDAQSLYMALDTFLINDLERKYDAIIDKNEGLLQKIKDPALRKKLATDLIDIKNRIDADLPEDYKRHRIIEKAATRKRPT